MNMEDDVIQEWHEFEESEVYDENDMHHVNIKASEISEIIDKTFSYPVCQNNTWTVIVMKNGNRHNVHMKYSEVMELV